MGVDLHIFLLCDAKVKADCGCMYAYYFVTVKWNPNISLHFAKSKLVPMIRRFKNLGVKLQCLTHEGKLGLVRIIRNFKTVRF